MKTSAADQRTQAEAAAAAWWQHEPFPQDRRGEPYLCSVCRTVIAVREGTSLIGSVMRCASCTVQAFPPDLAAGRAPERVGPPQEHLSYPVVIPEAMRMDAPWAPTAYPPPVVQPTPPIGQAPPFLLTPPPVIAGPPPARRPRRGWVVAALAVLAVAAVTVGMLVWAPWKSQAPATPAVPTGLAAIPTAQTATLHWANPTSGPTVDRYLITRNGARVGSVHGDRTAFVDHGLTPGVSYRYTVIAQSGSKRSPASVAISATMATPSPVKFQMATASPTSVLVRWSPPPAAPAPDKYVIVVGGSREAIDTVPGTQTSYRWNGLNPGSGYALQVVAYWGSKHSAPSAELIATTRNASVAAARFSGSLPLRIKIVSSGGGTLKVGRAWPDTWTFSPKCATGPCNVALAGTLTPPGITVGSFRITLQRAGAVYRGTTNAHITRCGVAPNIVDVVNTVTVRIRVKAADATNGAWLVSSWAGSLRMDSPYTAAGQYYCPAQSVTASLTSTG
jgi:hypothetical protein